MSRRARRCSRNTSSGRRCRHTTRNADGDCGRHGEASNQVGLASALAADIPDIRSAAPVHPSAERVVAQYDMTRAYLAAHGLVLGPPSQSAKSNSLYGTVRTIDEHSRLPRERTIGYSVSVRVSDHVTQPGYRPKDVEWLVGDTPSGVDVDLIFGLLNSRR